MKRMEGGQVLGDGRAPPVPPSDADVSQMPDEIQRKIDELLRDSMVNMDGALGRAEGALSEAMATAAQGLGEDVSALGLSYLQKAFKVSYIIQHFLL